MFSKEKGTFEALDHYIGQELLASLGAKILIIIKDE